MAKQQMMRRGREGIVDVTGCVRSRGIRVPQQLSIVGFDDTFEASIVTPPLTTVRQPLAEMGRMAVNLLIRQLQDQRIEALHVELATRLAIRESTAPAPGYLRPVA